VILAAVFVLATAPCAQAGDKEGEEQPPLPPELVVPPAPALSPEEALESFVLQPGFRIELVAAEPLVVDPVAMAWGTDGSMWVVEMRGFMPTIDGEGELEPVGSIAVLRDTDGDGRMDERTTFMDGLVLPRGVAPTRGGALVIAPPDLLFCRDTDGDGVADERHVVDTGFDGAEFVNPEHAINGLLPTLDNWYRCAIHRLRYRWRDGGWVRQLTDGGGQWGIAKDDVGRIFFNTNSDPLRCDRFPSRYMVRNPNHGRAIGANQRLVDDFSVWPSRVTPGVNRGYQVGLLRDGKLTRFTAACGPLVYRGDGFPPQFRGNAFVCEPSANLIARFVLEEELDGSIVATRPHPGTEFLTSSDERFRPVNLVDGPDGGLYVVDLYRGILQHRVYMTTFLRRQVEQRGLDTPIGRGRIWRVAHESAHEIERPAIADASWTQLSELLSDPSGWWRDVAQRTIVEEGEDSSDARELVRAVALESPSPLGRVHALWTLEGIGGLDAPLLLQLLRDGDAQVKMAAVRASEAFLAGPDQGLVDALVEVAQSGGPRLHRQVLFSLGEGADERCDAAMARLMLGEMELAEMRAATLSGMRGRELEFLERTLFDTPNEHGLGRFYELLARCVVREGISDRIERLLVLVSRTSPWRQDALMDGILAGRPPGPDGKPSYIRLTREPDAIEGLKKLPFDHESAKAALVIDALAWPGKPGVEEIVVAPLTEAEQSRFERGRTLYSSVCAACHQPSGQGEEGKAPRLRSSERVLGPPERAIRILLHGLEGPLEVDGRTWNLEMPAYSASDEDLASVLTYVRREWGHGAAPVSPDEVSRLRAEHAARKQPWKVDELE